MSGWEGFFAAQVGASAALAGLIFVGVSLNLAKVLDSPHLPIAFRQAMPGWRAGLRESAENAPTNAASKRRSRRRLPNAETF